MCEFLKVVEIVFNNWSSLKLCLDHGMGGDPITASQKLRDLVENVHTSLCKGEFYDLVDLLEDTLDAEFNTELQDDSASEVATVLFELHRGWHDGRKDIVLEQIRQMKFPVSILDARFGSEGAASSSTASIKRKRDPPPPPSEPVDVPMNEDVDADGDCWTVVSRRK